MVVGALVSASEIDVRGVPGAVRSSKHNAEIAASNKSGLHVRRGVLVLDPFELVLVALDPLRRLYICASEEAHAPFMERLFHVCHHC